MRIRNLPVLPYPNHLLEMECHVASLSFNKSIILLIHV